MTDILIRNVDDGDITRIDAQAHRLGLSRSEFLRRHVAQLGRREQRSITATDLAQLAHLAEDLLDEDVMNDAWS